MAKTFIHTLLNFLFPHKCLGCEENSYPIEELLCPNCIKKIDYPTTIENNKIFAATDYNDKIAKKAIWLLKYRGIKQLARPLAELIHQRLPRVTLSAKEPYQIIPIPLSPNRMRERGFNQAELIAKHLAEKFSAPMASDILVKIKETPSQVSIKDKRKRLENLNGAFAIKNAEKIKNKNIILIDDVSTTGATISEARKTLKKAGAKKVIAMVVARG